MAYTLHVSYERANATHSSESMELKISGSDMALMLTEGGFDTPQEAINYWQQVLDDLGGEEINQAHNTHRQDRKKVTFCSLEAYDSYGKRDLHDPLEVPVEEQVIDLIDAEQRQKVCRQVVSAVLAQLTEGQREVLMLARGKGLSQVEIAKRLGKTPPAVYKQLVKAEANFRRIWQEWGLIFDVSSGLPVKGTDSGSLSYETER